MVQSSAMRVLLAAAIVVVIPGVSVAQDERPSPEATTWHLVSYADDGELVQVPWYVDGTLVLEDGEARGSSGCRSFIGTYSFDDDALAFDGLSTNTDVGCGRAWMAVETGFMAALPTTNTWARDTGPTDTGLYLYDGRGDIVLTFAQSAVVLTQADISALASELDALRDRIRNLERRARSD